jgi:iron complex outermembrane receptor protein
VLSNCLAQGVDPTTLDNNGINTYSVEVSRGGVETLEAETSDSYTAGFSFEQPFFEAFDLTFGITYYEIEITDAIIEPSAQFLVNDCFNSADQNSALCSLIDRDSDGFLSLIDARFLNRDQEVARGLDYNLSYQQPVTLFGLPLELSTDLRVNRLIERTLTFVGDDGVEDMDKYTGTFGFPKWSGRADFKVDYGDVRFTWTTRYIGDVEQADEEIDEFSDIFDTNGTGFTSNSCIGVANGGIDCRDVGFADDYMIHSASIYYRADTWTAGVGVNNIFEEAPPQVDGNEVLSLNNAPIGYGYDMQGRSLFMNVQKNF